MLKVPFKQVDVFTTKPFQGNPVAVILDAQGLTSQQMQQIARWTNLSETTFVLPPENSEADYSVRIFTPESELPFAGHPTIGTAYALLESQQITAKNGQLQQHCGVGNVLLSVSHSASHPPIIGFSLPEPQFHPLSQQECADLALCLNTKLDMSLPPTVVDVGPRWIVAHLSGEAPAVLNTQPNYAKLAQHNHTIGATGVCIYGTYPSNSCADLEVRSFAPCCGVNEDPVCGSGNGSVAAFLRYHGLIPKTPHRLIVSQGQCVARQGQLYLAWCDPQILVSGHAVTCIEGVIRLD